MTRVGSKPGLPLWATIVMVLFFFAVLGAGVALWNLGGQSGPTGGGAYTLSVPKGATLGDVAKELQQQGVIRSAAALRHTMRRNGTDDKLQAGTYTLDGSMTLEKIAETLATPPQVATVKVVIPEGRRLKDILVILERNGWNGDEIQAAYKDVAINPNAKTSLEGFLFPATYNFPEEAPAREIVVRMSNRMNQEFTEDRVAKAKELGLSIYDWVTLASMTQAEAANNEEMPVIAGVFLNRLRDGIALGSDPTVAYGLGKDLPELDRGAGDFTVDHEWSTYTRRGLPKTPINNPGEAALEAVLNAERKLPDGRDALYFLHARDGKIYVNHTYQEHLSDNARHR